MTGRLDVRLPLWALLALGAVACNAGPQPEPPVDPMGPAGGRADGEWLWPGDSANGDDEPPPPAAPPPMPPSGYADAGARDAGAGGSADPGVPWFDSDGETGVQGDVAPFPFEPCCGWFALPAADAGTDAGPDAH